MSEDLNALLAHLRTDLELAQAELKQTERVLAAERVARMRAEASVAALLNDPSTPDDMERAARFHQEDAITQRQQKRALLAELEAARKIVATLRQHRDAGGEVWRSIDSDFAAYDAVRGGEKT